MRPEDAGISPAVCVRCLYTGTGSPLGCMRTGGGGCVCVTLQLYGRGLCVGRFASGREKGAGVYCTGAGACLRVRVGCAAGAGRVQGASGSGVGVLCRRGYVCSRGSGSQKYGRTVLLFCGTVVLKFSAFYGKDILKFPEQDLPDFISEEY